MILKIEKKKEKFFCKMNLSFAYLVTFKKKPQLLQQKPVKAVVDSANTPTTQVLTLHDLSNHWSLAL